MRGNRRKKTRNFNGSLWTFRRKGGQGRGRKVTNERGELEKKS